MIKVFGKELNEEELLVGAGHALALCVWLDYWLFLALPLSTYLWALGGAAGTSKSWRRIGVALSCAILISLNLSRLQPMLGAVSGWAVLSIGYGIPSANDEGSTVGKIFYKICNKDQSLATYATRSFLCALWVIGFALAINIY